jgi:hypothetical protein
MNPKALIAARVLPKLSIRKQGFLELVPSVTEQSRHGPVGQTVFLDNLPSSFFKCTPSLYDQREGHFIVFHTGIRR